MALMPELPDVHDINEVFNLNSGTYSSNFKKTTKFNIPNISR